MGMQSRFFWAGGSGARRQSRVVHGLLLGLHYSLQQGSAIAVVSIIILTAINLRSVKVAAWLQN